jgi:aconitate hydratase
VPAAEAAGTSVDQVIVGSCTNGSYADLATTAAVLDGRTVAPGTDAVVAPASKRAVELLAREGELAGLYAAGVNVSEATCGACIGQGHVPAPDSVSLRAFNRNFRGRSGNEDDAVYLASPAVAAASAVVGEIVDPRDTDLAPPSPTLPADMTRSDADLLGPDATVTVRRGETIGRVPPGEPLSDTPAGDVLLRVGDDVTTDHIVPASPEVMSLWSDPQACAAYTLVRVDEEFPERARASDGGWIVAGDNYGQGSSRENAALELAVLGLDGVIARSFARIHAANLFNFGLVPLTFADPADYDGLSEGDRLELVEDLAAGIADGRSSFTVLVNDDWQFEATVDATARERAILSAGGLLPYIRGRAERDESPL